MELEIITPTPIVLESGEEISSAEIPNLPAEKITSGTLNPARLPESVVLDDELEAAITVHQQASDPHPQYATDSDLAAHATGTGVGGHLPGAGITNSHVAPGAAIAWDKLNKTGAVPGDVGAAASAHTHTGLPYVGIAAPSSPAVGDRWLDTGDRLTWFWNGSYWLSEEIFPARLTSASSSIAIESSYNLYLLKFVIGALTGATHDSSNYWSLNLTRRSTSTNTTIATISTQAIAANTPFTLSLSFNLHLDVTALSILYFRITASLTGSPSGMSETAYLVLYRLAKP